MIYESEEIIGELVMQINVYLNVNVKESRGKHCKRNQRMESWENLVLLSAPSRTHPHEAMRSLTRERNRETESQVNLFQFSLSSSSYHRPGSHGFTPYLFPLTSAHHLLFLSPFPSRGVTPTLILFRLCVVRQLSLLLTYHCVRL